MSVETIIEELIREKCQLYREHPDTVVGHITHERGVTNDYRGRVLYELLQNAVDRADANIWIIVDSDSRSLIVANDGRPFEAQQRQGEPRSDLAALCSIDTSNKKPGESIGNKGVGFKSVWEFCDSVTIRTRGDGESGSWGIRLRWPFFSKYLRDWHNRKIAEHIRESLAKSRIEKKYRGCAPSFYFPEFIALPAWKEERAVTAIELENIPKENFERLIDGPLKEIRSASLEFVSDIRPDDKPLHLIITEDDKELCKPLFTSPDEWLRIEVDTGIRGKEFYRALRELGYELTGLPKLTLGFPLIEGESEIGEGKFHGYLPTEISTGCPLHVQGDFYLSESRKHIDFQNNSFNTLLLELCAEALITSIREDSRIAKLPYVFKILLSSGPLGDAVSRRLNGKGKEVSRLIRAAVAAEQWRRKSYFDDLFRVIGAHLPPKEAYRHWNDYYQNTVSPYVRCFSDQDLKIVPSVLDGDEQDPDPWVRKTCSLPAPSKEHSGSQLFCRGRSSVSPKETTLDVPGVVVTEWRFPVQHNVAEYLKKLGVWAEYETISVLRAIVRAQLDTDSGEEKGRLLKAAMDIYPPEADDIEEHTKWRFLSRTEVFPSQRLFVPVLPEGSWARVNEAFLSGSFPELEDYLDIKRVKQIDEVACKSLLGANYSAVLRYWGAWDVVPLLSRNVVGDWDIPLKVGSPNFGQNALRLFSASSSVWMSSEHQRVGVKKVLKELAALPWLEVTPGSKEFIPPAKAYLGHPTEVPGLPILNIDLYSEGDKRFLQQLGVDSIEQTANLAKLVSTLEQVFGKFSANKQITGAVRAGYRQVIKQVNKLLYGSENEYSADYLNRIPLLYEENVSKDRGIARSCDEVWYVPEIYRKFQTKVRSDQIYWWLANGDLGTLASCLGHVRTLSARSKMTIEGNFIEDENLRQLLEVDYLPYFLALACYGDVPGIGEIHELDIQKRWQALRVRRGNGAVLEERIGESDSEIQVVTLNLREELLLWEPRRADSRAALILFVSNDIDLASKRFKHRLCDWFADEVFRRRQLALHFKHLVDADMLPGVVDVSEEAISDVRNLIDGWLPDEKLEQLVNELSEISGRPLSKTDWRNPDHYSSAEISYRDIVNGISDELLRYVSVLNPSPSNELKLLDVVNKYQKQLAASDEFGDYEKEDWLNLLSSSEDKDRYDFDPFNWLLTQLSMTESEFHELRGRLDGEIRKTERDAAEVGLYVHPDSETTTPQSIEIQVARNKPRTGGILAGVEPEDVRLRSQIKKSRSGQIAEKLYVQRVAKKAAKLAIEDQERLLRIVKSEYDRLQKSDTKGLISSPKFPNTPCSEEEWLEVLYIASQWDGPGYDYLDFELNQEGSSLFLVEVKSSRSEPDLRIYLSENERLCILNYSDAEFRQTYPNTFWRLLLVTSEELVDATKFVVDIVRDHSSKYECIPNEMEAQSWMIRFVRSDSDDFDSNR